MTRHDHRSGWPLAQKEGAALLGRLSLAHARGHGVRERKQGQDLNLGPYTPLRLADVPELDISFVEVPVVLASRHNSRRPGRSGNAIFNAVGGTPSPYPDHAGASWPRSRRQDIRYRRCRPMQGQGLWATAPKRSFGLTGRQLPNRPAKPFLHQRDEGGRHHPYR